MNLQMNLPEPIIELGEPIELDYKRILVLSDIHIPFYDKNALETALKGKNYDCVILLGDVMDYMPAAKFTKKPIYTLEQEVSYGRDFFKQLRDRYKCDIIWYEGNHEQRLEKFICDKAPILYGLPEMTTEKLFNLEKLRIQYVKNGTFLKVGHLTLIHGNEGGGNAAVNVARTRLLKAFNNVFSAHSHVTQESIVRRITGDIIGSWSNGCLCQLKPGYAPLNSWNHGFAEIELDKKEFFVSLKKIYNNRIY